MGKIPVSQLIFHLAFWVLVGIASYTYIQGENTDGHQAFILSVIIIPIIMANSYLITYWLIPDYLLNGRRIQFFLYLIYALIGSLYLSLCLLTATFMTWADYVYRSLPGLLNNQFRFYLFIHLIVLVFVGLNAVIRWYSTQNALLNALKEKEQAELKFLKSQLQPHFLFNTLNNLYYLSLQQSRETPNAILKLSHLLDYVLSSSQHNTVPLQLEWEKLQDYLYLESMRYKDRLSLVVESLCEKAHVHIPPLCLITLAENCFKHGAMDSVDQVSIEIKCMFKGDFVCLSFENSLPEKTLTHTKLKEDGIGLANSRKQLDYHFGKKYKLTTESLPERFRVELKFPVR
jgi:sensor histidine kinase YesM